MGDEADYLETYYIDDYFDAEDEREDSGNDDTRRSHHTR